MLMDVNSQRYQDFEREISEALAAASEWVQKANALHAKHIASMLSGKPLAPSEYAILQTAESAMDRVYEIFKRYDQVS
jgi:hypothetical protein